MYNTCFVTNIHFTSFFAILCSKVIVETLQKTQIIAIDICATMWYNTSMKAGVIMNAINKTLYIPLYSKSYVSKKGIILNDKKAEQIWDEVAFELSKKASSKWLCYYMAMRARVFDDWVIEKMNIHNDAVVLHIGCGLDSRNIRVGTLRHPWYDIDFPEVIAERMKYFHQTIDYSMIEADATNKSWLDMIPHNKVAIIIMEGISMYIKPDEFLALLKRLSDHFEHLHLLVDTYTQTACNLSAKRNPVSELGVSQVYGIDDPMTLTQSTNLSFVSQHSMTPNKLIGELCGFEKFIFSHLYAGRISNQMYRMYEYKKEKAYP